MDKTCIINPATGRAVKIDSRLGKKLAKQETDKPRQDAAKTLQAAVKRKTAKKPSASAEVKKVFEKKIAPKVETQVKKVVKTEVKKAEAEGSKMSEEERKQLREEFRRAEKEYNERWEKMTKGGKLAI